MTDPAQARAYAEADFEEPHGRFIELLKHYLNFGPGPLHCPDGYVLDLGCGPADITIRFARAFGACTVHGIDGAAAMLDLGKSAVRAAGLEDRIELVLGRLPAAEPPRSSYDGLISNALLHHLDDPAALWASVRRLAGPGAFLFVMDLLRPASPDQARALVERYAGAEPEVLRRDFYNSLRAAYVPEEVAGQLAEAGLDRLEVEVVSDRHLIVWGRCQRDSPTAR